jgi:hypothetical protein
MQRVREKETVTETAERATEAAGAKRSDEVPTPCIPEP